MAAHTMQCNVIIPEHTNKQDLAFKNHKVVSDDFLGHLCISSTDRCYYVGMKVKKYGRPYFDKV